jgi:hypothetical protein
MGGFGEIEHNFKILVINSIRFSLFLSPLFSVSIENSSFELGEGIAANKSNLLPLKMHLLDC